MPPSSPPPPSGMGPDQLPALPVWCHPTHGLKQPSMLVYARARADRRQRQDQLDLLPNPLISERWPSQAQGDQPFHAQPPPNACMRPMPLPSVHFYIPTEVLEEELSQVGQQQSSPPPQGGSAEQQQPSPQGGPVGQADPWLSPLLAQMPTYGGLNGGQVTSADLVPWHMRHEERSTRGDIKRDDVWLMGRGTRRHMRVFVKSEQPPDQAPVKRRRKRSGSYDSNDSTERRVDDGSHWQRQRHREEDDDDRRSWHSGSERDSD